jgi:hypothetical protein
MNLSGIAKLFLKCQFELQNCIIDTSELADRREQGSIKGQRVPYFYKCTKLGLNSEVPWENIYFGVVTILQPSQK